MAYISDVVAPEKRAGAFGLIGAAFGLGFIVGPALGGWLGAIDPRLPFWVAGGLSLLNAAYGFFVPPESLPIERRRPFTFRRANPVGSLVLLRSHPELFRLSAVQFIGYTAHEVVQIYVLYAIYRYAVNRPVTKRAIWRRRRTLLLKLFFCSTRRSITQPAQA